MPNIKTHMGWLIACLAVALIGTLSVQWADLPDIPNMISVALGMSSLVLALIAIFQSMSAGSGLHQTLGKIDRASDRAIDASNTLTLAASQLGARTEAIDQIDPKLEAIRAAISDVGDKTRSPNQPEHVLDKSSQTKNTFDEDEIYNLATKGFNLAIYIALRSFKTGKTFSTDELFGDIPALEGALDGYLVGMRASGVMEMDYLDGKIRVRAMGPFTEDTILTRLNETTVGPVLGDAKKKIDDFFDSEQ